MEVLALLCARGGAWCHPSRLSWRMGVEVCLRVLPLNPQSSNVACKHPTLETPNPKP